MAALATLANQQNIDDDDIYLGNWLKLLSKKNYYFYIIIHAVAYTYINIPCCYLTLIFKEINDDASKFGFLNIYFKIMPNDLIYLSK